MNMESHPLENTVVLNNLLRYIEPDEFSTFRLVSKTWFATCLRQWRANKPLVAHPLGNNELVETIESEEFRELCEFLKYPYVRLQLNGKKIELDQQLQTPIENFWQYIGASLTHLTLKHIAINGNVDYFVDVILSKTPNLTDLVFQHNSWDEKIMSRCHHWDREPCQRELKRFTIIGKPSHKIEGLQMYVPWKHFFRHFPNLESLEIKHVSHRGSQCFQYFEELVHGLDTWEKEYDLCPLKTLKLGFVQPGSIKTDLKHVAMTPQGVIVLQRIDINRFQTICNLGLPKLTTFTLDLATDLETTGTIQDQLVERFPFVHVEH